MKFNLFPRGIYIVPNAACIFVMLVIMVRNIFEKIYFKFIQSYRNYKLFSVLQ